MRTVRTLSFDSAQVIEASGSRYGPAAPLTDFKAVLDRGRPFAFIGKACDISAIRNYAASDPRVDELLKYTLNFFCGGVSKFSKTMDYVRKVGLTEPDVAHLRYRGDGCPGPMVMKSHAGDVHSFSYNEMWEDENRWELQFRCKICPDSIGDLADITVADVWPGGKPDTEGLGFNGFIARTVRGERLLQAAVRDGAIKITEDLRYDGLELAQGSHMLKKQALTSRLAAMRDAGLIVPQFEELRLREAAAMSDEATRRSNYEGMRDRLLRGDNLEPVPVVLEDQDGPYPAQRAGGVELRSIDYVQEHERHGKVSDQGTVLVSQQLSDFRNRDWIYWSEPGAFAGIHGPGRDAGHHHRHRLSGIPCLSRP